MNFAILTAIIAATLADVESCTNKEYAGKYVGAEKRLTNVIMVERNQKEVLQPPFVLHKRDP
jgi:hypothetical protein